MRQPSRGPSPTLKKRNWPATSDRVDVSGGTTRCHKSSTERDVDVFVLRPHEMAWLDVVFSCVWLCTVLPDGITGHTVMDKI
jgi:hypothetical protein